MPHVDCLMSVLLAKQRTWIGNIFFAKPFIAFAPHKVVCTARHILMKRSKWEERPLCSLRFDFIKNKTKPKPQGKLSLSMKCPGEDSGRWIVLLSILMFEAFWASFAMYKCSSAICKSSRKRLNISAIKMAVATCVGTFVSKWCLWAPGCQGGRRTSLKFLLWAILLTLLLCPCCSSRLILSLSNKGRNHKEEELKITSDHCGYLAVSGTSSGQCDSSTLLCGVEADVYKEPSDPSRTACMQNSLVPILQWASEVCWISAKSTPLCCTKWSLL